MDAESNGRAITQRGGPKQANTFVFASNIAIVDGDSSYHRRHKTGHFKGERFPFGVRVEFMPQPDVRVESMVNKTIPVVFVGYHVGPGSIGAVTTSLLTSLPSDGTATWPSPR